MEGLWGLGILEKDAQHVRYDILIVSFSQDM